MRAELSLVAYLRADFVQEPNALVPLIKDSQDELIETIMMIAYFVFTLIADIAQLVERLTCNQKVVGSIPTVSNHQLVRIPY